MDLWCLTHERCWGGGRLSGTAIRAAPNIFLRRILRNTHTADLETEEREPTSHTHTHTCAHARVHHSTMVRFAAAGVGGKHGKTLGTKYTVMLLPFT